MSHSSEDMFKVDSIQRFVPLCPCMIFTQGVESVEEIMEDWHTHGIHEGFPALPRKVAEKAFALAKQDGVARIFFPIPGLTPMG